MNDRKDELVLKNLVKSLATILICVGLSLVYGCTKTEGQDTPKKTVQLVAKKNDSSYWYTVMLGAEAAGKEFDVNVKFSAPLNEDDINEQVDIMNKAIEDKVDGIVLAASDYKKLVPVTERAIEAGIPVVIVDSELNSSKVSSFIATDNKEAGELAGERLAELTKGKADVAIVSFVKGTAPAMQREQGFLEAIEKYPDIKVVTTEYSLSDEKRANEVTKEIIKKYGKIDAIAALNGYSAIGVARAIEELGLSGKVKVVAFDNFTEEIDYLEEGVIQATVVQNPYSMGYLGIKNVLDVLNKKDVSKHINTDSKVIDKGNMYTRENQKLLFPFVE